MYHKRRCANIDSMSNMLQELKSLFSPWYQYQHISSLLSWDQETYMPESAAEQRADQLALMAKHMQEVMTSDQMGEGLSKWIDLDSGRITSHLSKIETALIQKAHKRWRQSNALPSDFVQRWAKTTSQAQFKWQAARESNQYALFSPYLSQLIDMVKEKAQYIDPQKNVYDQCLDDYEPGLSAQDCNTVFTDLRAPLIELLSEMTDKTARFPRFQGVDVPEDVQWNFGMMVARDFGYDFNRGRQDRSAHPFTIDMGPSDVRITTRIKSDDFSEAFSSTVHELGHGLYEQGLPADWQGLPIGESVSLGVHESQSRFWENMIAKRRSFWEYYFPKLQEQASSAFGSWDLDSFVAAMHRVQPGLIRVEADEISYCLHVMLRFDCEQALILEGLDVADLPDFWNEKMNTYLGITPDTDANGVLQDVHWSAGLFGYFPTYALGSIMAAQLWKQLELTNPNIDEQIRNGDFTHILNWLRQSVHSQGSLYQLDPLLNRITQSGLDATPFLNHLQDTYRALT